MVVRLSAREANYDLMHKQTVMLQNIVGTGVLDGPLEMQRLTVNVVLFEDRLRRSLRDLTGICSIITINTVLYLR